MKKLIILLFYLCYASLQLSQAQNEKFKALFMYNFTKYIEWPAAMRSGNFVIGVLGTSTLTDELRTVALKQKVGTQNIEVVVFNNVEDITDCHILYIPQSKSGLLSSVNSKLSGKATLLIGDKPGLVPQGACINYIMDGDKLKYEVSRNNIEKKGLAVSSALLALGVVIN